MLRDIERGGKTEVEHILGFMLDKALKAQIACNTLLLATQASRLSSNGGPQAACSQCACNKDLPIGAVEGLSCDTRLSKSTE
jgi:hypothetical protein